MSFLHTRSSDCGRFRSTTGITTIRRAYCRGGRALHPFIRNTKRKWRGSDGTKSNSFRALQPVVNSEPQIPQLVSLCAMLSQMRVLSLPRTIACAPKIMLTVIDTYFSPNRTMQELRKLVRVGAGIDPLKEFSEVARQELRLLKKLLLSLRAQGAQQPQLGDVDHVRCSWRVNPL